jgi:hypothetical protein
MMARSLTVSSTSPSDSDDNSRHLEDSVHDLEKQEGDQSYEETRTRNLNAEAVPGVQLAEAEFGDAAHQHTEAGKDEPRQSDVGRAGVADAIERIISRTSTKSWSPGPPPDGGLQAWIAGEFCVVHKKASWTWSLIHAHTVAAGHLVIMNTWYVSQSRAWWLS